MQERESEFVPEEEAEQGPALIKKLREKLKKAIEEKQEYLDGWQRSRADFANFKKEEAAREGHKEERIKAELAEAIIPTLDSLEMALKNHPTKELEILQKQLLNSLKKIGVERFGKSGEEFSPHRHEALAQTGEGDVVVSVERSGYSIGDKVIRPAHITL
ncbi:nucleotide exchange factor GrpE [Candidatus Adlerbacteria bacterium RIFCSPLOWO2_01_FULL_51_16]|uniref:Protein GrpE n=1 Tax=Candidatus Adlerbacteria bacterium RIFCSPLOWO2_01_FULL_51_16 TaxID=1797243 RepID=A0A1F4XEI0_9BACT|nr:MAG: nucleotide exchange factor GrpE [Candidatus Adlerbacteria bacterium RIFCSPLOWO2_01_FULL_51_16]